MHKLAVCMLHKKSQGLRPQKETFLLCSRALRIHETVPVADNVLFAEHVKELCVLRVMDAAYMNESATLKLMQLSCHWLLLISWSRDVQRADALVI